MFIKKGPKFESNELMEWRWTCVRLTRVIMNYGTTLPVFAGGGKCPPKIWGKVWVLGDLNNGGHITGG